MALSPRLSLVRDPTPVLTVPAEPMAYAQMPPEALRAWSEAGAVFLRLKPLFAGSYVTSGRMGDAPKQLDAIAIAALKAAAAIRSAGR